MHSISSNKEKYRRLCVEKELPLFMQAWWLDAVCLPDAKQWEVLLYEENGKILAAMPYHLLKKWGFKIILQPQETQYTGIWIDYPNDIKLNKRYSLEKQVINNFIDQLEDLGISFYSQNFHHSYTNWQPFYWRGFRQTTKYTYQIKDLSDIEKVFKNFSYAKQKHIKKDNEDLLIDFTLSADEFYNFHKQCLQQKNAKIEYSQKLFLSIYKEAVERSQGKIIALKDKNNNLHSALFFVWDNNSAYALNSAINSHFKSDGASTKMFWEAMKFISNKTQVFDFEGSMTEGVAQSFQQFGAEQVPYFNISKSNSHLFNFLLRLKK